MCVLLLLLLLSDILSNEPANLANSAKLVVAGADYFRAVYLHRQLTDIMRCNLEILILEIHWCHFNKLALKLQPKNQRHIF